MKRLLLIVLFALIAFYIAWPAVSAWQIYGSVQAKDPSALSTKVDFPGVRNSMQPAVQEKISQRLEQMKAGGDGTASIVAGLLPPSMVGKLTEIVLASIVTPENMIRLAHEKGSLPEKIERIINEQMGQLSAGGGAGASSGQTSGLEAITKGINQLGGGNVVKSLAPQKPANPVTTVGQGSPESTDGGDLPEMGLNNIKHFAFAGPLAFDVGLARDPNAGAADLTARMEFKDLDWKLTQVVPNLR